MSAILILDANSGAEEHRIDTTNMSGRDREKAFLGVMRRVDLDRFIVSEVDE